MKSRGFVLMMLTLLGLVLSSAALADKGGWSDRGRDDDRSHGQSRGTSLDEAVGQVRQRTGARILSAGSVEERGRVVHRIRILTPEGRVKTLEVDGDR